MENAFALNRSSFTGRQNNSQNKERLRISTERKREHLPIPNPLSMHTLITAQRAQENPIFFSIFQRTVIPGKRRQIINPTIAFYNPISQLFQRGESRSTSSIINMLPFLRQGRRGIRR